MFSVPVDIMQC